MPDMPDPAPEPVPQSCAALGVHESLAADAPQADDRPTIQVTVSADKLLAFLTMEPPASGRVVDREEVQAALHQAGVVWGIDEAAIGFALAEGKAERLLVARGLAPVHGDDAEFKLLIPDIKDRKPKVDDTSTVDFRELGLFVSVTAGAELMLRRPATHGMPGKSVLGEILASTPGKDLPFAPKLDGAIVDPGNSDRLIAAITGQPLYVNCGVTVEPVLRVPAVDLSTGNIDFAGSVDVLGDVKSGMKVHAQGDITVHGVVEAAELEAKGSVIVKGGVIGHSEWSIGDGEGFATAHIVAEGAVHTRFTEHAIIESGASIHVLDSARQSLLCAIQKIVVGAEDAHSGHLIGGCAQATLLVQAGWLGSVANVPTRIEVGLNPTLVRKVERLDARMRQHEKEKLDLLRLLTYAKANPQRLAAAVVDKARLTALHLNQQIIACTEEREVAQAQLALADDAKIVAGRRIYGGVVVKVGEYVHAFADEREAGTLRCVEGNLHFA